MTINRIKVKNLKTNFGNDVPNQFVIDIDNKEYFQSYRSIIAMRDFNEGKIYLDEYYWDYSRTTGKYRNIFLNENKRDTEAKIKSGEYILTNLN